MGTDRLLSLQVRVVYADSLLVVIETLKCKSIVDTRLIFMLDLSSVAK